MKIILFVIKSLSVHYVKNNYIEIVFELHR